MKWDFRKTSTQGRGRDLTSSWRSLVSRVKKSNRFTFAGNLHKKERRRPMNNKTDYPSRRRFLKGLAIGAGGYAIGFPSIFPPEAAGQPSEDFLEQLSMPSRWAIASSGSVYNLVSFSKYRYDKEGQKKYNEERRKETKKRGPRC
jgi:hypothetical protein